jgi:hypothetical protein
LQDDLGLVFIAFLVSAVPLCSSLLARAKAADLARGSLHQDAVYISGDVRAAKICLIMR